MNQSNGKTRTEDDLLGEVSVPFDAFYGAQTQRAVRNFSAEGQRTIGDFPQLVEGLIRVKQAATTVNRGTGQLDGVIAQAILDACRKVLDGGMWELFPVHHLHGGGGTSANMNTNEVLANLAEEILGGRRGEYRLVHPNDHVNLNQSTNDVYPTACHIAVILRWPQLSKAVDGLARCLDSKADELSGYEHIARTCLQDAVPIGFGDWLGGYVAFLRRSAERIACSVDELRAVSIGGTIVGKPHDVAQAYFDGIIPALRDVTGDPAYRHSDNLFDAAQNLDNLVGVSQQLDLLASGLVKMCKDLRLLSSGPEAGLGEITLPPAQPGSSVMPGKVNPVIPEFAIQLSLRAMGLHASCRSAVEHGELDLNVWESLAVSGVLESMNLLQSACEALTDRCIAGIQVEEERSRHNVETIIPLVTRLARVHGYARVSDVCREAGGDISLLRQMLRKHFPDAARDQEV